MSDTSSSRPIVLKFGGTSVGTPGTLRIVPSIVRSLHPSAPIVIVASAAAGLTDHLSRAADSGILWEARRYLTRRYDHLAGAVLSTLGQRRYHDDVQSIYAAWESTFSSIEPAPLDPVRRDHVLSFGERLSVPLVAQLLREHGFDAVPVEATQLLMTSGEAGRATVLYEPTRSAVQAWYATVPVGTIPVVTGFIGESPQGQITTVGRGGSDYSAACLAAALDAQAVHRWTDTQGIFTADPNRDPSAKRIVCISLDQANVLTSAGKFGMHPSAVEPLLPNRIPLHIRSTFEPEAPGTLLDPTSGVMEIAP